VTDREHYTPGPASGAQIRQERGQNGEDKWTLILIRELRHAPEKVWQALTDPAHLRERGQGCIPGEAHDDRSARAARYGNNRDASRRSHGA
jgi:hypothetical protein